MDTDGHVKAPRQVEPVAGHQLYRTARLVVAAETDEGLAVFDRQAQPSAGGVRLRPDDDHFARAGRAQQVDPSLDGEALVDEGGAGVRQLDVVVNAVEAQAAAEGLVGDELGGGAAPRGRAVWP